MNKYKYIIALLLMLPVLTSANSGIEKSLRDTANPLIELTKIEDFYKSKGDSVYSNNDRITWHFDYTEVEEDSFGIYVKDEQSINLRVCGDLVWMETDSLLVVQDSLYSLTINNSAQSIEIGTPIPVYKHLLVMDLFDTTLYARHIQQVVIYDSTDGGIPLKRIEFDFHDPSPYSRYEITYKPASYEIVNIVLHIKNRESFPEKKIRFSYQFNNTELLTNEPDRSFFYSMGYIKRVNGEFIPKEPYQFYKIFNSIAQ